LIEWVRSLDPVVAVAIAGLGTFDVLAWGVIILGVWRDRHTDDVSNAARDQLGKPPWTRAYGFGIITALFFVVSWAGQFVAQLLVEHADAAEHGQPFEWSQFIAQFLASTFENWQSEFLQLIWQAAGLALLYYWGSSQSRESDDRIEAKLDALLDAQGIDADEISRRANGEA
jgi:hypothetical protein